MLNAKKIEHAKEGMHADGKGLYLRVQGTAKTWVFRFQLNGKRRLMTLGNEAEISVQSARAEAADLVIKVKRGIDPIDHKQKENAAKKIETIKSLTFEGLAGEYIETHRSGWKSAKHANQWASTLEQYVYPVIGAKPPEQVTTDDLLMILKPIWNSKTETASRVRNRIELVWSYAKARKLCQGENPAAWRGHLDALLPKPSKVKTVRHHPALEPERVSHFINALRSVPGHGARCLELVILTATRSQEARLAQWKDLDLDNAIWTIPAANMKASKEHRVPLSDTVVNLIKSLPRVEGLDLLFPNREGKPISDMTLTQTIRRMDAKTSWRDHNGDVITAHGFRSSFRDWAGETTHHAREVVEHALAHQLPNKAEAAYARGSLFDKRRALMNDWADWCGAAYK